jgi:hypothetical protein
MKRALVFGTCCSALLACGGTIDSSGDKEGAGATTPRAPVAESPPVEPQPGVGAAPQEQSASQGVGLIVLGNVGQYQGAVGAQFYASSTTIPDPCPKGQLVGPCLISPQCATPQAVPGVSAGTLSFTGSQWSASSTSLTLASDGTYETPLQQTLFSPGTTLTVSATGGDAPAFSGLAIDAPSPVTVTTTAPGGFGAISTTADLPIQWTGGQAGALLTVYFNEETTGPVQPTTVACAFDASLGQATIPQAALAPLAGLKDAIMNWDQTVSKQFDVAGWSLQVQASADLFGSASFE